MNTDLKLTEIFNSLLSNGRVARSRKHSYFYDKYYPECKGFNGHKKVEHLFLKEVKKKAPQVFQQIEQYIKRNKMKNYSVKDEYRYECPYKLRLADLCKLGAEMGLVGCAMAEMGGDM